MWGNAAGWAISAMLVVVTGWVVVNAHRAGAVTEPTAFGTDPENFRPLALPIRPESVVAVMTQECEAGALYREAIALYLEEPELYSSLAMGRGLDRRDLPAIERLVAAASCRRTRLFVSSPAEVVHYEPHRTGPMPVLYALGRAAVRVGLSRRDDPEEADRYLRAAFALGAHLYQERLVYEQLRVGLLLMGESTVAMAHLAEARGQSERAEALRRFDSARLEHYQQRIEPMWRVISSIDPRVIAVHSGDIFELASPENEERLWRVEATLKLGRQRFHAARAGDSRAAERALEELVDDADPVVARAARVARDLTIEEYRQLGR